MIHVIMSAAQLSVHLTKLVGKCASLSIRLWVVGIPNEEVPMLTDQHWYFSLGSAFLLSLSTTIVVVGELIDDVHKSGNVVVEEVILLA